MFGFTVDVTGDKTYLVKNAFRAGASAGLRKIVFDIEANAKRNITDVGAVDTGAARASIYSDVEGVHGYSAAIAEAADEARKGSRKLRKRKSGPGKGRTIKVFPDDNRAGPLEGINAVGVEYGANIEFGSAHMAGRPFFGSAAERVYQAVEATLVEEINSRLED